MLSYLSELSHGRIEKLVLVTVNLRKDGELCFLISMGANPGEGGLGKLPENEALKRSRKLWGWNRVNIIIYF